MERFKGKVAIVTGASSGIGRAISKELWNRGLIVFGLARRMEKLQELAQEVKSETNVGQFHPVKCDVTQENDIRHAFDYITRHQGAPSILVNNAGIFYNKEFDVFDVNADHFDTVFNTNTRSLFLLSHEAVRLMEQNSIAGHILNINSIAGYYIPNSGRVMVYSASKHASRIFSEVMKRLNTEKQGTIKISNVSPGLIKTELTEGLPFVMPMLDNPNMCLTVEDVARACISILDTPPNVLISELVITPIHQEAI